MPLRGVEAFSLTSADITNAGRSETDPVADDPAFSVFGRVSPGLADDDCPAETDGEETIAGPGPRNEGESITSGTGDSD